MASLFNWEGKLDQEVADLWTGLEARYAGLGADGEWELTEDEEELLDLFDEANPAGINQYTRGGGGGRSRGTGITTASHAVRSGNASRSSATGYATKADPNRGRVRVITKGMAPGHSQVREFGSTIGQINKVTGGFRANLYGPKGPGKAKVHKTAAAALAWIKQNNAKGVAYR
jgi:hypothetical protein